MGWGDKGWIKKWGRDPLCKSVSAVKPDRWKGVRYSKTVKGNILKNRRAIAEYQGQESAILEKGCKRESARAVLSQVSDETYDTLEKRWDWHEKTYYKPKLKDILTITLQGINVTKVKKRVRNPHILEETKERGHPIAILDPRFDSWKK